MRDIYWDEHGRRYSRRESFGNGTGDQDGASGEVGVAMDTVRYVKNDSCPPDEYIYVVERYGCSLAP